MQKKRFRKLKKLLSRCLQVLLLITLGTTAASAAGITDTDNHIAANNKDYEIPRRIQYLGEENGWIRDEKNLITNFYSMYQPEVIYAPDKDNGTDYPYMMWFFAWSYNQENEPQGDFPGFPGGDAIFCGRAKALEGPWEIYSKNYATGEFYWDAKQEPKYWQPVIVCQDTWYDSWHVGDSSVVYLDGVYYMAYSSMGADEDGIPYHLAGDTDGNTSTIMGATSRDGINWEKSNGPLLAWEGEKGFNERDANNQKNYFGGYQRPSLMLEEGVWKMWFDYEMGADGIRIGYAENKGDPMNPADWVRIYYNNNPLIRSVDFDVVKIGDVYYAYGDPYTDWYGINDPAIPKYEDDPYRWSARQIVEYQSLDGFDWKVTGYFQPDTGYPANQIPQVFLDHKNNRVCILYATQRGKSQGSSSYDWRWDNIRMMYRDLSLFETPATRVTPPPPATPTPKPTRTPSATPTNPPTATPSPTPAETPKGHALLWAAIGSAALFAVSVAATLVLKKKKK